MFELNYRYAQLEDIPLLSVLFKQVYIDTYASEGITTEFANFIQSQFSASKIESSIKNNNHSTIVAIYKGNPVGVVQLDYKKKCPINDFTAPEINKLYVLHRFFGNGIAQELMKRIEAELKEKGITNSWLWVLATNHRAIEFYQKQGYSEIGNADFEMETNTYSNIVMRKYL